MRHSSQSSSVDRRRFQQIAVAVFMEETQSLGVTPVQYAVLQALANTPDVDQRSLARLLGFGRDIKGWRRVRAAGGMRGWLKCTDGRLYHAVVAEKARDAWVGKMAQRWRTECARIKKHNQRHKLEGDAAVQFPDFDVWMSQGCPQGQPLPVPGTKADGPQGQAPSVPRETASKGQGEGQGQGQGDLISEASASGAAAAPPIPPTDRDLVFANGVTLLTAAGVSDKNARSFLAAQCKAHGERAVRLALERCATERPIEPVPWLVESLKAAPAGRSASKPDRIAAQNADVVRRFAERNPQ
mgnify:CR=1 FL=1